MNFGGNLLGGMGAMQPQQPQGMQQYGGGQAYGMNQSPYGQQPQVPQQGYGQRGDMMQGFGQQGQGMRGGMSPYPGMQPNTDNPGLQFGGTIPRAPWQQPPMQQTPPGYNMPPQAGQQGQGAYGQPPQFGGMPRQTNMPQPQSGQQQGNYAPQRMQNPIQRPPMMPKDRYAMPGPVQPVSSPQSYGNMLAGYGM